MRVSEDEDRQPVQTGETTEPKKRGFAETVERSEGQTAVLAEDVQMELSKPWISETAQDSRQTLNEASLDTGDVASPNDPKLTERSPETSSWREAAGGEGAGCAGLRGGKHRP